MISVHESLDVRKSLETRVSHVKWLTVEFIRRIYVCGCMFTGDKAPCGRSKIEKQPWRVSIRARYLEDRDLKRRSRTRDKTWRCAKFPLSSARSVLGVPSETFESSPFVRVTFEIPLNRRNVIPRFIIWDFGTSEEEGVRLSRNTYKNGPNQACVFFEKF